MDTVKISENEIRINFSFMVILVPPMQIKSPSGIFTCNEKLQYLQINIIHSYANATVNSYTYVRMT